MLNLDLLLKTAPPMPETTGAWIAVYLEPMLGSGERLAIIVAAITSAGDVLVKPAIRKEVIEAMYGFKASSFTNMVDLISRSLKTHLELTKAFSGWTPPITGVTIGTVRQAASSNVTGILRQAVSFSSSLSALIQDEKELRVDRAKRRRDKDRWSTQLMDAVVREDIRRESFFNRSFSCSDGHRPAKIFYLSDCAAINTGKLLPVNLPELVKDGKAKISDLSMVKKHSDLFSLSTHKLIVYRPEDNDPAYTDKNIESIKSAFLALQDLAETYGVGITSVHSVAHAADIILKTAA